MLPAYEIHGEGPVAVLFVHAFPLDRRMWTRQIDATKRRARVIAVDLRGFGAASDREAPTTIADHADDLAAVLDDTKTERAVLVGCSMGGYVALAFAKAHPDRLAGLFLSDTKAGADGPEAREARAENIERARREGVPAVFEAMLPKVLPDGAPVARAELAQIAAAQPVSGVVAALAAMRDRPDATPVLPTIRVPTRVVVGRRDLATPVAEAELLAREIPGAILSIVEGAGHFPNVERPDAFGAILSEFLDAVGPA
jgi:pimeloyl-ACP methyl ester carboxylesterase